MPALRGRLNQAAHDSNLHAPREFEARASQEAKS